jgi:hypothetical protein
VADDSVSLDEQIASVEREVRLRERVYPRWVSLGKLNRSAAEHELDCMVAVLKTLQDKKDTPCG